MRQWPTSFQNVNNTPRFYLSSFSTWWILLFQFRQKNIRIKIKQAACAQLNSFYWFHVNNSILNQVKLCYLWFTYRALFYMLLTTCHKSKEMIESSVKELCRLHHSLVRWQLALDQYVLKTLRYTSLEHEIKPSIHFGGAQVHTKKFSWIPVHPVGLFTAAITSRATLPLSPGYWIRNCNLCT